LLKGFIYVITIGLLTVSCSSARRLADTERTKPIDNAPVRLSPLSSKRVYKGVRSSQKDLQSTKTLFANSNFTGNVETSNWLQFKYALLTDVPVEALANTNLLNYMEDWYGAPYHYGGSTKQGVDCSAFSAGLMAAVFNVELPRTAREQYVTTDRVEKYELHEGDLVFFNTHGGVSHVGVYLINNKFVHASVSSGVMISDLNDEYFVKRYIGAGRVKVNG
jgi:cell wall-associated NlpC family hydrolase